MHPVASYHTANFCREATIEEYGQRLDRSLTKLPANPSKHLIQRLLRTGKIRVNGQKSEPNYRLQSKDLVSFPQNFLVAAHAPPIKHLSAKLKQLGSALLQATLYEDQSLLICNKPAGIAVHGGTDQALGLITALRSVRPEIEHLNLVHRLDKPTSGLLLFSKSLSALRHLHRQFEENQVKKCYLALLYGSLNNKLEKWTIDEEIPEKKIEGRKGSLKGQADAPKSPAKSKAAQTHFSILEKFSNQLALAKIYPKQGRTHQIRIHAAQSGLAILGDEKYLKPLQDSRVDSASSLDPQTQMALKTLPKGAIYLHARSISFNHPQTKKTMTLQAPLPDHWQACLEKLNKEFNV